MTAQMNDLTSEENLEKLAKYLRFANYIAAAQLYLKDNFLLEQELSKSHLKQRILGHWGTVPGLNFIYATLNQIIRKYQQETMLIVGPGHGYPALLANLYLEGTLGKFYPKYQQSKEGMSMLIRDFSWPGGFPSHANPETPGVILEGGELGYALSTAFGAAMDNPDLIVACVVGDGEAETGPTATAWHSNKFLNPVTSGAVLPIVHINKYKISGPTIYGTMDDEDLLALFRGYGYDPILVDSEFLYEPMLQALEKSYQMIKDIQNKARSGGEVLKPRWPVILLVSKKGWTGPEIVHGKMIEDSFRSHGIPLEEVHTDEDEFQALKSWLESYKIQELLDADYKPLPEITELVPEESLRIGMCKHANGGLVRKDLNMPDLDELKLDCHEPCQEKASNMKVMGDFLRELMRLNPDNFRVMSPDETESNKLHALFDVTQRAFMWPIPAGAENISPEGRVMEMLSEHTLQGWMEGYTLTGRHGVLVSYEAFLMIISSMVDQYSKFLKQMEDISWRKPIPSLNFVLTSTSWRQDHNGFSHQNPGFISDALNNHTGHVNIHFPPDANTLLATLDECYKATNKINVLVTGKRDLPQYLSLEEARNQVYRGLADWEWAGNHSENADVVIAATGDYATQEALAALKLLKQVAPELNTKFISVSELTCFGIGDSRNACRVSLTKFRELFTEDKKILYTYHGYPEDIKQLIFGHPDSHRFKVYGYIEQGTTTTPFDMQVKNSSSRYHLALDALEEGSKVNDTIKQKHAEYKAHFEGLLNKHHQYIKEKGIDIPEITNFELYPHS